MLFNDAFNTLYMVMWRWTDSERGNPLSSFRLAATHVAMIVESILYCEPIGLFHVPTSDLQLV